MNWSFLWSWRFKFLIFFLLNLTCIFHLSFSSWSILSSFNRSWCFFISSIFIILSIFLIRCGFSYYWWTLPSFIVFFSFERWGIFTSSLGFGLSILLLIFYWISSFIFIMLNLNNFFSGGTCFTGSVLFKFFFPFWKISLSFIFHFCGGIYR